jgi:hypothetical protein
MSKVIAVVMALSVMSAVVTDWNLPVKVITPGVTNPAVTQANIQSTICVSGWTATIRPSSSYTTNLKAKQLSDAYQYEVAAYGTDLGNYEEDHLISLELGGNPTDPKNLWPQPYAGQNSHKKDALETKLKTLVCTGKIKLAVAQKAIASNWVNAYKTYVAPIPAITIKGN